MNKTLLIGGPGTISTGTIDGLLAGGYTVGVFTRTEHPPRRYHGHGVRFFKGNRDDTAALESAIREFKPDCIIDFICFTPEQAARVAPLAGRWTGHYVFVSTVDVYGYPLSRLPMKESDPFSEPVGEYAANKLRCEMLFRTRSKRNGLPLTIVRPTYSFGNSFLLSFLDYGGGRAVVSRIRAGKPLLVPGDGTTLMHVSASCNTGRQIAEIARTRKTIGRCYTVGHDTWITADEYYRMMGRVLGREPVLVHIPSDQILALDIPAIQNSPLNLLCKYNLAFSMEQFKNDFPAFRWKMGLEQWFKRYVTYHDTHGGFASSEKKTLEDRIVTQYTRALKSFKPVR